LRKDKWNRREILIVVGAPAYGDTYICSWFLKNRLEEKIWKKNFV
jgi:hypothetical protein